jgi:hypothetical protein
MTTYRYSIDSDNAVRVFANDDEIPFLYQPTFPNGDHWINAEEAENWALLYISSIEDYSMPFAPNGRGQDPIPQLSPEELEIDALQYTNNE